VQTDEWGAGRKRRKGATSRGSCVVEATAKKKQETR